MTQRLLTTWEQAQFFLRHPLEADYVAKTKIALFSGTYDWAQTFPDWFFGLIPPWGTQVKDSEYGNVTIYFSRPGGVLYVSGYTAENADINKPAYTPPAHKCKDGSDLSIIGTCPEDFNVLYWWAGGAVLALVVVLYLTRAK